MSGPKLRFFAAFAVALVLINGHFASGQSLSLDDDPALFGGFGNGAEDEFGLAAAVLAPSPSLGLLGIPISGNVFTPGVPPALEHAPNGRYIDAFSTNHLTTPPMFPPIAFEFSVDRITFGSGALAIEAAADQQSADLYASTATFPHPMGFVGTLGAGPFAGVLPSAGVGGTNVLIVDDSIFGLTAGGAIVPPMVPTGPKAPGSHDNIDAYDAMPQVAIPLGGGVFPVTSYFAVAPDEAALTGLSAADIIDTPPFAPGAGIVPYATSLSMGLDTTAHNSDSIDALVVWDFGLPGGTNSMGPGAEPALDFALFSLAPGSATLTMTPGLSAADVFFTDFTGAFGVFAFGTDLGVAPEFGTAFPFQNQANIDALEIFFVPEPSSMIMLLLGIGFVARRS